MSNGAVGNPSETSFDNLLVGIISEIGFSAGTVAGGEEPDVEGSIPIRRLAVAASCYNLQLMVVMVQLVTLDLTRSTAEILQ